MCVRAYLARLQVPLFVWTFGEQASPEWPAAALISGRQAKRLEALEEVVEQLRQALADQHIAEEELSWSSC